MLVLLLAVMIVSFVFTIGNFSPFGGQGGARYKEQPFLSYDLSSARDQQEIFGHHKMIQLNEKVGGEVILHLQLYKTVKMLLHGTILLIILFGLCNQTMELLLQRLVLLL